MIEVAALLQQYFPPQVVLTAIIVWIISRMTFKTKDAKDTAIRAHRRIDKTNERVDILEAK